MVVVVTTDVSCSLAIDGVRFGEVRVGEPAKVPLAIGEHKLEAESLSVSQDRWVGSIDVSKTTLKPAITVELLAIQNKRIEAERRAAEEARRAEELERNGVPARSVGFTYETDADSTGRWSGSMSFSPTSNRDCRLFAYTAKVTFTPSTPRNAMAMPKVFPLIPSVEYVFRNGPVCLPESGGGTFQYKVGGSFTRAATGGYFDASEFDLDGVVTVLTSSDSKGITITPDPALVLRLTPAGFEFVSGKGTVRTPNGKLYRMPE